MQEVIGRDAELATLSRLVTGTTRGQALVIEGEAGIGKSTLVRSAVGYAEQAGFTILSCTGVRGQRGSGLAGLHELLHPVLDHAGTLPHRQRSAILAAFGLTSDPEPDRLFLSLATLGLLEEIAGRRRLLLVAEDIQWLDRSTTDIIGFVARRLGTAPILLLATSRSGEQDPLTEHGLPRMRLEPLSERDSEQFLTRFAPPLGSTAKAQVLREAAGNPLALQEFPAALQRNGLAESSSMPIRLPLTSRLEQAFAAQIALQPPATRILLLLLAAADDLGIDMLTAAGARLGAAQSDLTPALDRELVIRMGDRILFRHSLIGSAVYGAAPATERILVHRTLAEALVDPDAAAWHRGAATLGSDEVAAAGLEATGARAVSRGAPADAARALRRAGELSPQADARSQRYVAAAENFRQVGLAADAEDMVRRALSETPDAALVVRLALIQGLLSTESAVTGIGVGDLRTFAHRIAGPHGTDNPDEQMNILVCAAMAAHQRVTPPEVLKDLDRELQMIDPPAVQPLVSMALAVLDPVAHAPRLRARLPALAQQLDTNPAALLGVAQAAEAMQDLTTAASCWATAAQGFRRPGTSADLCKALVQQARLMAVTGDPHEATAILETGLGMAVDLGMTWTAASATAVIARMSVRRGDSDGTTRALQQYRVLAGSTPLRQLQADAAWAQGLADLTERRYAAAWDELSAVAVHPGVALWAIGDLCEAAVHSGNTEPMREVLAAADAQNAVFGSAHLASLLNRSRALLDPTDDNFRQAVRSGTGWDLARTQLLYGEWLRRERRVVEAREPLGAAMRGFESAGSRPWAQRTAAELRAAGAGPDPAAAAGPGGRLTAQEMQIAHLAAAGMTNRQIADHVFISSRTVSSHLYRIFPKLGITSRVQLRDVLTAAPSAAEVQGTSQR